MRQSMNGRSYLDYNATAPMRPAVRAAMSEAFERFGNPSSVHQEGRSARAAIETARAEVAKLVGARPDQVIFTGGGSEANALALAHRSPSGIRATYVSAVEHPSVLAGNPFDPEKPGLIPVDAGGVADLEALAALAADAHLKREAANCEAASLFSLMSANNETGVLQPVEAAAAIVHDAGGLLHTDAVQAAGKVAIDFAALGADLMSLSAHKLGGPKGIGALIVADGVPLSPLIRGGAQEMRRRAGTENVPAIIGFGVAAKCAAAELAEDRGEGAGRNDLRQNLEREARAAVPDVVIFAASAPRLPNTASLAVPGTKAETVVIGLDLAGVAVSSGSACSSGKVEPSHVLAAMGVDEDLAQGAIRISFGWASSQDDVSRFLEVWVPLVKRLCATRAAA